MREILFSIFFLNLTSISANALANCAPPTSGILVYCHECTDSDEMISALEAEIPNEENLLAVSGELRLAITFTTLGINTTAFIPLIKTCGQTWEKVVESNWTDIQEELGELLLASGSGGGLGGSGGTGGTGGSGGGPSGGGSTGGGDGECLYSDGDPIPGNPPDCPPSDPNVGFSEP